jgi:heme O synthase-like polyprenyltransferase
VIKPFPNLIYKKKDRNLSSTKSKPKQEENVKSKPLIIFGFIISITSIFLLLFTINNKFG